MKRIVFYRALLLCLSVWAASGTFAADPNVVAPSACTYYADSQSGSDSSDGLSETKAWKSLDVVNGKTFSAGDTILFKAGCVWKGQLKPQGSGTPDNPIRIDQYGSNEAAGGFNGLPRIDAEGQFDAALHLYNVQGWEVRNLELTNTGPADKPRRSGVWVQIRNFGTARHIILEGLYIHDVNGSLVKKAGGGQGIHLSNEGNQTPSRFDGLKVSRCLLRRCQRNGIIQSGYWQRNRWYPNINVVFRGNLLEEIPGDGIVPIGCDGAIIEYNRMRNCPRLLPEGEAAAGIWPWSCDNTIIQYNEVSDHKAPWDGQGFDSDWNCRNTIIQYNFSHDNEGGFLLICNDSGVKMPTSVGNTGTIIRYNLSVNDGFRQQPTREGIFSPTFHISGFCKDTKIYNNTIIIPKKPAEAIDRHLLRMDNWGNAWPENTIFQNNIFYVDGQTNYKFGGDTGTIFLNNLYFGTHADRPADEKAVTADPKFAAMALAVPRRGAVSVNHGFRKDSYILNFHLQKDSPCIGKGILIPDNGGRDLIGQTLSVDICSQGAMDFIPQP
jgi:hypothetical protein